jgi:N-methylhydantoinase B/oxoprolinase/acetone carboxylase alpha subunit
LGASIISDQNFYMTEAARELGLEVAAPSEGGSGGFSIFDGTQIVHNQVNTTGNETKTMLITLMRMALDL